MRTSLAISLANRAFRPDGPTHASGWTELGAGVVGQIDREFMVGPPLTLHRAVPSLFAGVSAAGYLNDE